MSSPRLRRARGHGPEGVAHHPHVGQEQLALPLRIEEVGEALEVLLDLIGVDGDAAAPVGHEPVGQGAILGQGEAALEPALPARVVPDLGQDDGRADGIPHAGRPQHLEGGAGGDGGHVPGEEVGLALLEDARGEVLGMELRVLQLDVGIGLGEALEGPAEAVAREGVDDDLALLLGRGHRARPLRGGRGQRGRGGHHGRPGQESRADRVAPAHPLVGHRPVSRAKT